MRVYIVVSWHEKSDAAREEKTHSFVPLITASYYKCFGRDKTIFSKLFYRNNVVTDFESNNVPTLMIPASMQYNLTATQSYRQQPNVNYF